MLRGLGSSSLIILEEKNDNLESSSSNDNLSSMLFEVWMLILGLVVWRAHEERLKLEDAERSIEELKARRKEDAMANEKAVGMFATREQTWFSERKKLRKQIGALQHELRVFQTKSDESQYLHSAEILKHKTAFIELLSKQRQLEEEMGRALMQTEAAKQELHSVSKQKEESMFMVHKLSMELVDIRKDLQQKDCIFTAMLRKSKLDRAEKHLLLKEIKLSKAKRKQAEIETEWWKSESGTINEKQKNSPDHKNESEFISSVCLPQGNEQQHQLEIEAFAEQMRLKDEKLEACGSLLLSMEMKSKRLQAHIEGLEYNQSQLRKDNNIKLQWFLKKQLEFPNHQNQTPDPALSQDTIWSNMSVKESLHASKGELIRKPKESHALGVSYKVKRLKHQIHMLERLIGKQQDDVDDTAPSLKTLLSLLHKQVNRYQSLQVKVDELYKRIIHEKDVYQNIGECSNIAAAKLLSKEERKSAEQLLGESFKLQRYIVATGQRMIEIQSKVHNIIGFDMKMFAENVKTLFRKVQRGLDVRISRVIGDLDATLSRNGMTRL